MIDRSLDELLSVAVQKLRGSVTTTLFNQLTRGWKCLNAVNYVKADQCYKIITCDPLDDTVGQFESTMAGVAKVMSRQKYNQTEYEQFF